MNDSCQDMEIKLERYLDGDLPFDQATQVENHLRECHACRGEIDRERLLRENLTALPEIKCPPLLVAKIVRALDSPSKPAIPVRWRLFPGKGWRRLALAAAAPLALVVLLVWSSEDNKPTAPEQPYSQAEILAARQQAKLCLALAVQIVGDSEREAFIEIFGNQLPKTIQNSLQKVIPSSGGGQG
jgi:anti-sigma factor RsiW